MATVCSDCNLDDVLCFACLLLIWICEFNVYLNLHFRFDDMLWSNLFAVLILVFAVVLVVGLCLSLCILSLKLASHVDVIFAC